MPSNLLDLKGPEFLTFFIITLIGLIVIFAIARLFVSHLGREEGIDPKSLSPHELAFLAAGGNRVGQSVVAELVHSGSLIPDAVRHNSKWVKSAIQTPVSEDTPQGAALNAAIGGATVEKVIRAATSKTEPIAEKLREQGLLTGSAARAIAVFSGICFLSLTGLGIAKLVVGLERGRPVGFLILLLLAAVGSLIYFAIPVRRTATGTKVIRKAHADNAALKTTTTLAANPLNSNDLGLAVAIFGTSVLASSAYGELNRLLPPCSPAAGPGGLMASCGGASTWTGGSSCGGGGGGSSCGGGGGGGGGCGGCGGGGS